MGGKNKKKVFKIVDFTELTKLKEYLEQMAAKGWMIKEMSSCTLTFEKINPIDVVFSLDIFPDADVETGKISEKNWEYIEYCKSSGWTYAFSYGYLQIFYSKNKNLIPIETDKEAKVDAIWKVEGRGKITPCLMCIVISTLYIINSLRHIELSDSILKCIDYLFYLALIVASVAEIISLLNWKRKAKNAEKEIPNRNIYFSEVLKNALLAVTVGVGIIIEIFLNKFSNIDRYSTEYVIIVLIIAIDIILSFAIILFYKKLVNKLEKYTKIRVAIFTIIIVLPVIIALMLANQDDKLDSKIEKNLQYQYCVNVMLYFE